MNVSSIEETGIGDEDLAVNPRRGSSNTAFTIEEDPDEKVQRFGRVEEKDIIELTPVAESSPKMSNLLNTRKVSVTAGGDAVVVRGAEKSYKSGQPVLNGFNMTVPCGSIYGLLGSSGCGKTTVLSCIVGQRKLDRGDIWIFGSKPGTRSIGVPGRNIGYMPQDISLYGEFSIGETLKYFGTLSGASVEQIKSTKEFLSKLLDLPADSRTVSTLSGGQQRRVSFASALIHDPELLVLDEPTVGVDPLLRQNIWLHLQKLVSIKRTTIIITTHYIEECRQADNIGIMRNGRLLKEQQTRLLFDEAGTTNLESIVLDLSRKDSTALQLTENNVKSKKRKARQKSENVEESDVASTNRKFGPGVRMASVMQEVDPIFKESLFRIRALMGKNFVILARNPLLFFFVLLICAVMIMIICLAIGPEPRYMSMGLVNHELDYLSVCPNTTRYTDECSVESLSCHFLNNIPPDRLHLTVYDTVESALIATQKGAVWGYIAFPSNFSENLYERMASGPDLDQLTWEASQIIVRLDESNKQIAGSIKKSLYDAYENFTKTFLQDCGFDSRLGDSPLGYRQPIFGKDDTNFREFLAPGLTPSLIFFFPIISTSIRLIKEKKNGILDRSIVSGVQTWEIMVAYSISEFFVLLCQSILNYCILTFAFQVQIVGSHFLVILVFLLSGYGGVSMGFLLGSVCTEEIQAAIIAMAAFFPNFALSGILWPVEGMTVWLQYVVQVLPCTFGGESVRSVTSRGWGFTHPNVWPGFAILVAYIVGYFILTILFHKFLKK